MEVQSDSAIEAFNAVFTSPFHDVCESCADVALDEGAADEDEAKELMRILGRDLPDHICESVEDNMVLCGCGCQSVR